MAEMYLTIFDQVEQVDQEALEVESGSLYRVFEQVKDRRGKKGKRYPLAFLLTLLLLGKMAGETKLEGILDWINERQKEIKKLLNWPKRFPVSKTYIDAEAACDHQERAKAIAQVIVKARAGEPCDEEPSRLVAQKELGEASLIQTAVDGKILRWTLKHGREDQPPVRLLSFYECESGIVLDQLVVQSKNNEESARPRHIPSCPGQRTHPQCRCDRKPVEIGVQRSMHIRDIISSP